ncbi:hypothetical protein COY43_01335 [Candidatus Berkelbacteria bacterium CG_4_10_14_0_8_um_filter_35_9_33_8]|uniref:DUF192 domain-containing protein n=1 Tax=Candidatus Berkelbacteria bacterium CG_4_10_14_0_2_um_filter_35_9_33_12 TaxID=1974499 RepID=A0A2M7W4A0_9BACT|nr:MAG: hypothetical protein COX10_02595 [Candidatus Berkelbacteria bacterium CG23_combo_of_CG06-09_8_20_14_all_33_15]PIS08651.1 MAG: hypothetical protein COT76_00025 [Candidatus Berkelbacteria bacterium CG10_big_fil_rev_8_21_14_0_10_33_10]PIZ28281.1 MAG: hypothetical protein COY43_01335 [Candidatus Berkelbacteria bacterium CG_4_10_14_0_8_um_filter_35_9_33_8]PJA20566.1 MAG: hypothetical protein COX60_01310 [Candidatus Berkelbacteria bacterium CG_4_10_14_0_2_um_filter_35_9_33_12]
MDYKKIIVWVIAIVLVIQIGYYFLFKNIIDLEKTNIKINQQIYSLWIADNDEERFQGLQNIEKLKNNQGMIFNFNESQNISFWNKNTFVNLAILWVDRNVIVGIDRLPQQSSDEIISVSSPQKIDQVIELNQNQIELNQVKVGDKITILK